MKKMKISKLSRVFRNLQEVALNKFRDRALDKISALVKAVKELPTEVSKVSMAIDQVQEYSCSYNLKLVGVPT